LNFLSQLIKIQGKNEKTKGSLFKQLFLIFKFDKVLLQHCSDQVEASNITA